MTEAVSPNPVHINESHVFQNGDLVLSPIGQDLYYIKSQISWLDQAEGGQVTDGDGKVLAISEQKISQIQGEIVKRFVKLSESLGFPNKIDLLPEVLNQYNAVSVRRNGEVQERDRSEIRSSIRQLIPAGVK